MTRVADHIHQTKGDVYEQVKESTSPEDLDLAGWVAPDFLPAFSELAKNLSENALIIEVGTWKGASTNLMANKLKSLYKTFEIVAVDTWLGSPEWYTWGIEQSDRGKALQRKNGYPTVYFTFIKNVILQENCDYITPFPLSSVQAAEVLAYHQALADIIYIDASHEEYAVYADLEAYWPLLKKGGRVFGDDWNWIGVQKAVERFCTTHNLNVELQGIIWKIAK